MNIKPGIKTTELWVAVGSLATSVILALVAFGVINQTEADALAVVVTALIGVLSLVFTLRGPVTEYVKGRAELKREALRLEHAGELEIYRSLDEVGLGG